MLTKVQDEPMLFEHVYEMMDAQTNSKDRRIYFDVVCEAINNPTKGEMLQTLYRDIMSHANINFYDIPNSKGNLKRYSDYKILVNHITALDSLYGEASKPEEMTLMINLHAQLLSCVKDFEFGFAKDIDIIKLYYNTLVMSLYQLIDLNIVGFNQFIQTGKHVKTIKLPTQRGTLIVVDYVKEFLTMCKTGKWASMIKEYRGSTDELKTAFEADSGGVEVSANIKGLPSVTKAFKKGWNMGRKDSGDPSKKITTTQKISGFVFRSAVKLAIVVVAFMCVRKIIYLYYQKAYNLKEWANDRKEILELYMMQNEKNMSPDELKNHVELISSMDRLSNYISAHVFGVDEKAREMLRKSNVSNYTVQAISNSPDAPITPDSESDYEVIDSNDLW